MQSSSVSVLLLIDGYEFAQCPWVCNLLLFREGVAPQFLLQSRHQYGKAQGVQAGFQQNGAVIDLVYQLTVNSVSNFRFRDL